MSLGGSAWEDDEGPRPASQETCRQPWSHAKRVGRGVLTGVEPCAEFGVPDGLVRGDVPLTSYRGPTMRSIIKAGIRRSFWLASTVLMPLSPFAIPAAHAQQSASPDLLPPVQVSPPKRLELGSASGEAQADPAPGRGEADGAKAARTAGHAEAGRRECDNERRQPDRHCDADQSGGELGDSNT